MNCKNCNTEVTLNYCANCGQPVHIKRINGHYILHEIEHEFHFEKGILYTVRELLLRPGENIKHFLTENRSRLVKPSIFIVVTSLIYTLVNHYFHIEDGYPKNDAFTKSATGFIFKWVQEHYGYSNVIMGVFIAFWIKIFFKKYGYNFYEILILLCFTIGMGMLFFALFAIVQGLSHYNFTQIAGVTGIAYCSWAIGQFFDKQKPVNYIKAFTAYILGMLTFTLTAIIVGISIDLIIKH
nr:DUF3667 domain-containing protein [uncultured Mucilaginibacter sp.]